MPKNPNVPDKKAVKRIAFEHFKQPLLPFRKFVRRSLRHFLIAVGFIVASLLIGMVGYHSLGHLEWIDAFVNASMILTGMGPVNPMPSVAAKMFSGCYAIYSGVAFLTSMGVLFAPLLHRAMHRFHISES